MNKIVAKKKISEDIIQLTFENKELAEVRKPGQFLILRVHDKGERIPLTIMGSDAEKGTVDIIFQVVGKTTTLLSELNVGDERTYEDAIAIRAVISEDAMTANWAHLPYSLLEKISNKIINEVKGINRVVYDISSKPPSTIEWE